MPKEDSLQETRRNKTEYSVKFSSNSSILDIIVLLVLSYEKDAVKIASEANST